MAKNSGLKKQEIKELLNVKHDEFNRPDFIALDPVSIPHRFQRKEDVEIAGLLSAILAWGRRDMIIRAAHQLVGLMGESPYDFVMNADEEALESLRSFVYRTFQGPDGYATVLGLRRIYRDLGGLESLMALPSEAADTAIGICALRQAMLDTEGFPDRSKKHFANPAKGSSAKRLNMYLRWMVRQDRRGVDFGIWENMKAAQLICPLDVHTGNVGRKLGLLKRKQNDWKSAIELTASLREFDPVDPVRYDFALFGLGIFEGF